MVTCAKGVFDLRLMDAPIPSPAGKLALVAMQLVIQTRSPGTRGSFGVDTACTRAFGPIRAWASWLAC